MSKYILKKDLPFAKAGTEIDCLRSSKGTVELSFIKINGCKCDIPDNVNIFDWIEEVIEEVNDQKNTAVYWERMIKYRIDKVWGTRASILDYPVLLKTAIKLGAKKIEFEDGWTKFHFDGLHEEKKEPREWILEVTEEQEYLRPYSTILEAKRERLFSSGSEIIKVREVTND